MVSNVYNLISNVWLLSILFISSEQAVNADEVFLLYIAAKAIQAFFLSPIEMMGALAKVLVKRHTKTTRGLYEVNFCDDKLPCGGIYFELRCKQIPFLRAGQYGSALTVEAQDIRWAFKSAEHEGDASVFEQMGGSFIATTNKIHVTDLIFREQFKAINAFGGKVDMSAFSKRGGCGEENLLFLDEIPVLRQYGLSEFSH